jgi:hypothetical protein
MPGDHLELPIDQDRDVETECLNAVRDLADLLVAMEAGILRIESQRPNWAVDDR